MKNKRLIYLLLIIFIISMLSSACGQQAQENPQDDSEDFVDTGIIAVESSPNGAEVYVNDRNEGQTPLTLYNIPVGDYDLKVIKEGYDNFEKKITVKVGKSEEIDAILNAAGKEPERELCAAVCRTVYALSDKCAVNECGSGCGGDSIETFNSQEECRSKLPQGESTIKLASFAMYHDFDNGIFSEAKKGSSDVFSRKYADYVDFASMPPAKIEVIEKPLTSVKRVDCINTNGNIAQLKQGQSLCILTMEGNYFAAGLKSIDEMEYLQLS
jgi:hypothetical protein